MQILYEICSLSETLHSLGKFAWVVQIDGCWRLILSKFGAAAAHCRLARMLHAVIYAFGDSVNALLIGILVAIGIILPRGKYRKVAPLIVAGDWLGVLVASLAVLFIFVGIREQIVAALESPITGIVLIAVGVLIGFGAWRSKGESNPMVEKLLVPLREPSLKTAAIGFVMGVVQSLTSVPFYGGLLHLAAGEFSDATRYLGTLWYATLALSLPTLCGFFIALVRAQPHSAAGKLFTAARENSARVAEISGYVVAVFLVIMGVLSL